MVKLTVKINARGLLQYANAEMELEADNIEDMEKLLKMAKENFKLEFVS